MTRRSASGTRPAKRRAGHRRRRHFIAPPNEACWIESDSYDREAFGKLCEDAPSLRDVIDAGLRLAPRFGAFVEDLFSLCFKHNVIFRDPAGVAPSAQHYHPILERLAASPAVDALRQHTLLDETQAGLGALLLAEEVLEQLRKERLWTRDDLGDLWALAAQEDETRQAIETYEVAAELAEGPAGAEDARGTTEQPAEVAGRSLAPGAAGRAADAAEEFARAADVAEARLRQKTGRIMQRARSVIRDGVRHAEMRAIETARDLAEPTEDTPAWGLGIGRGHRSSPGAQLELGKRLAKNPKLRRLAQMVGRMRECAFQLRKRVLEHVNEETYAIERGGTLDRLLPQELVSLRHPALKRDFQRRLVEGDLQLYELRGIEDKGRGPMVVCLDGSSSMGGDKELWSKAVALTLLDIARRQRRLFRFLCFSSADQPLWSLDVNPRTHYEIDERKVYDLAEYFPGGGTDFETPLSAAVECLGAARYKRGDIVLITDGECQVSADWLARFAADKARLGFFVFSVLIDVGSSARETVGQFSDRITSVATLTDDAARDLFLTL